MSQTVYAQQKRAPLDLTKPRVVQLLNGYTEAEIRKELKNLSIQKVRRLSTQYVYPSDIFYISLGDNEPSLFVALANNNVEETKQFCREIGVDPMFAFMVNWKPQFITCDWLKTLRDSLQRAGWIDKYGPMLSKALFHMDHTYAVHLLPKTLTLAYPYVQLPDGTTVPDLLQPVSLAVFCPTVWTQSADMLRQTIATAHHLEGKNVQTSHFIGRAFAETNVGRAALVTLRVLMNRDADVLPVCAALFEKRISFTKTRTKFMCLVESVLTGSQGINISKLSNLALTIDILEAYKADTATARSILANAYRCKGFVTANSAELSTKRRISKALTDVRFCFVYLLGLLSKTSSPGRATLRSLWEPGLTNLVRRYASGFSLVGKRPRSES